MREKLVVGNWKMNGGLAANSRLLDRLVSDWQPTDGCKIAVCVPFPYLGQAQAALGGSSIAWGAQDVSAHPSGAFTGEVGAAMLVEFGCRYAIVGHSERRQMHREGDELVAAKAKAALGAGITPIVCIGETLAQRDAGETNAIVARQLQAVIDVLGADIGKAVVAYEPVWAIGTGRTATPAQAQDVHAQLRAMLTKARAADVALLYGGSVKASNARALFGERDVDGGLVGGASLDADEFLAIARAA